MQIILQDGSTIILPEGSTAENLVDKLNLRGPGEALAANINGKTVDLHHLLQDGDRVILLSFDDPEGKGIFWHTSAHVLAQAILRIRPDAKPTIGPPIENGFYYDFANLQISDSDFPSIEKEMKAIVSENFKSKREVFATKEEALQSFAGNPYKCEMIQELGEQEEISGYRQGEFFDLCRGPHLPSLGKIKALKIMKTSGAYWRGDPKKEMLTRIYGITFPDRKQLVDYLHYLEEAKKRDHRALGAKLNLFSLSEEGPGMPFIHPHGMTIWTALTSYLRESLLEAGYAEIKTPILLSRELWELSGHWANYRELMFTSEIEKHDYAVKPMNCPGCMLYYRKHIHSYRELPLRIAEIGNVHRNEPSGALSGLFRVRSFHQDDAHVFMKPGDIEGEILSILRFADALYSLFGLSYHLELSTKPEKDTIGTDEEWEAAATALKNALNTWGQDYRINEGEGAFYGPKIDLHIRDAINRRWQCGTIQLDMALPDKFELEYTAQDGTKQRPVMLHRAIFGSIERFMGILIEHFAGKFPLWLSPRQIRVLTVADRHQSYARQLAKQLQEAGFLCDVDDSGESVSKKVRQAQLMQVNYMLTVGDKEVERCTCNLRTRDNVVHGEVDIGNFIGTLTQEKHQRLLTSPFEKS
ncbi:MAG: threonine--tRNA ligase [Waddliaceae bacterium]